MFSWILDLPDLLFQWSIQIREGARKRQKREVFFAVVGFYRSGVDKVVEGWERYGDVVLQVREGSLFGLQGRRSFVASKCTEVEVLCTGLEYELSQYYCAPSDYG